MIPELAEAIERGEAVVLATVIRTNRSVPRRPGSKMLVFADGRTIGTVGGGEMEHRVALEAARVLSENQPTVVKYELVDPADGHAGVCGGEAEIYLEPYMPKPTILVIGAGHVGRAVCGLASWLNFRTVVWDDRPEAADGVENVDANLTGALAGALSEHPITADTSVVMVTRNVALDLEILPVLFESPARYIGLMGSIRRWETTQRGLVGLGITDDQIARVQAPIGIEIKAETPEEIAVSIIAEVIGARNGG